MLKRGSTILSIWSGINFLLAALILIIVVFRNGDSPILAMVFENPKSPAWMPRSLHRSMR